MWKKNKKCDISEQQHKKCQWKIELFPPTSSSQIENKWCLLCKQFRFKHFLFLNCKAVFFSPKKKECSLFFRLFLWKLNEPFFSFYFLDSKYSSFEVYISCSERVNGFSGSYLHNSQLYFFFCIKYKFFSKSIKGYGEFNVCWRWTFIWYPFCHWFDQRAAEIWNCCACIVMLNKMTEVLIPLNSLWFCCLFGELMIQISRINCVCMQKSTTQNKYSVVFHFERATQEA